MGVATMRQYYFTFVTSPRRILHSLHGKFDDDRQAEIFARGNLAAAEPPIIAVEAWEGSRLACRVERTESQPEPI
jgi:hypothetical protein